MPTDVPKNIELDITELEMNNSYSVADLKVLDDDVTILSASDLNIVSIQPPAAEEEPLVDEEEMIEGEEMEDEEDTQVPDEENKKQGTGDSAEES